MFLSLRLKNRVKNANYYNISVLISYQLNTLAGTATTKSFCVNLRKNQQKKFFFLLKEIKPNNKINFIFSV